MRGSKALQKPDALRCFGSGVNLWEGLNAIVGNEGKGRDRPHARMHSVCVRACVRACARVCVPACVRACVRAREKDRMNE